MFFFLLFCHTLQYYILTIEEKRGEGRQETNNKKNNK